MGCRCVCVCLLWVRENGDPGLYCWGSFMTVHYKRRCPQRAITAKTDSKWLRLSAKVRLWRTECVLNRHFCLRICCFLGLMWIFNTNHIKDRYYLPNSAEQSPLLPSSRTKETSLPFLNYSFSLLFLRVGSVLAQPVLLRLCIEVFLDFIERIPHVFVFLFCESLWI